MAQSNEQFTLDEFLIANGDYPGNWQGTISRLLKTDSQVITLTDINSPDFKKSYVVPSIFSFKDNKINKLDEYWAENESALNGAKISR